MDKISFGLYEKSYRSFYYYCISGSELDRKHILELESDVKAAEYNPLFYIYEIMKYADGRERADSKGACHSRIEEAGKVITQPLDAYCYYSTLELVYTYIYPDTDRQKECRKKLEQLEKDLNKNEKSQIESLTQKFNVADYKIRMHIKNGITMKDAYAVSLSERDFRLQKRSFLMILKGFSSSTPFFYPALEGKFYNSPIKGGGIFLRWKDMGVAIDPGINFIENMHMNGLGIEDINAVVVTHEHIDHNGDLMIIDDFASQFGRKDIELYADKDTISKISHLVNLKDTHTLDDKNEAGFYLGDKKEIKLEFISTKHIPEDGMDRKGEYRKNVTFALKIKLSEHSETVKTIGLTSDTEYFSKLPDFFSDCDLIIANISETSEEDYKQSQKKQKHLGYTGCLKLIRTCNKKSEKFPYYIISEFWAGKGDVRREIVRRLRCDSEYPNIYPGDIGMVFFLDQPTFLCEHCRCEVDMADLHLVREKNEYGRILTICDNCLL